jgi:glycosyltransferase involved in cell wall biosynthesis
MGALTDTISAQQLDYDLRGLGLTGLVHFIGPRADARPYFHAFDVFAMVSREDPFPLVCLEAASAEIPIVCFDYAGGTKEFVEDDCGAVLPYQDVDAMAAAILQLRSNDDMRQAQGRCASEKARRRHDIDCAAPKIVEIVERLLDQRETTTSVDVRDERWASVPPTVHHDATVHTDG